MSKPLKITLAILCLFVLVAGVAAFLLSRVNTQARFETMVSEATGLTATVGSASISLFPMTHVSLHDVTLGNGETQIASVGEAGIGVAFWPLLRRQVRINRLQLRNVNMQIERDSEGHFNFARESQTPAQAKQPMAAMHLGQVSLANATISYVNKAVGKELKATDCKFDSEDVRLAQGNGADIMKNLTLHARVVCAEMHNHLFAGSDVRFEVAGEKGLFKFSPVTMKILDGEGSGDIDADFNGDIPAYQVHYKVKQLHVDRLFQSLSPGKVGEGFMDFSAELSMRGFNAVEMTRTAQGKASLRGKDLDIAMGNLDEKLSRYESSQNFNLVDVGAFFIAGPLGTVATKSYNFASIFRGTTGSTHIGVLVSEWQVENGVAHAQDVAMATAENRLAMKGALDFVHKDFDAVTVAILDERGCARIEQKISGPFNKPDIAKPNVLISLAGPISRLVDKATKLVGVKCEVFYAGSVP